MKIIFLDIDGVLNNEFTKDLSPMRYRGINSTLVKRLAKIVKETNAKIVLSSDWKDEWEIDKTKCSKDGIYINEKLSKEGLSLIDKTNDKSIGDDISTGRGFGIRKYLKNHPEVTNWVVLDDNIFKDFTDEILEHFVHTNYLYGITEKDVHLAINILKK